MSSPVDHHQPQDAREIFGFLSYAREDMESFQLRDFIRDVQANVNEELKAHRFNDKLRDYRFTIRYDDLNIPPSANDFWLEIKGLIEHSQILFIVLSRSFITSRYFIQEYRAIINKPGEKLVYIFCLERSNIPPEFWQTDTGSEIHKRQILDLPRPEIRDPRKYGQFQSDNNEDIYFSYTNTLHRLSREIADFIQKHTTNKISSPLTQRNSHGSPSSPNSITNANNVPHSSRNQNPDPPQNKSRGLPLTRREIIFSSLLGAGFAGIILYDVQKQQNHSTRSNNVEPLSKITWKMRDEFSRNKRNGTSLFGAKYIADLVKEMSNQQFLIELDDNLDKGSDLLELVHQREIDCTYGPSYYHAKIHPSLIFGTTVPFGFSAQQQLSWLNHSYGDEQEYEIEEIGGQQEGNKLKVMQTLYRELGLNVIPFTAGGTGGQMGGWFREQIPEDVSSFADYANEKLGANRKFRFRVIGLAGDIIKKDEETIEIYEQKGIDIRNALENGELDAAEWIGPLEDIAINLNTVKGIKYYYYPGWWDPGTTYQLQVNLQAWRELPLPYKRILKGACQQAYHDILTYYDNSNSKLLDDIKKSGIQLRRFPDKLMANMEKKTIALLEEKFGNNSNSEPAEKRLYSEWKIYKERIKGWYRYIDSA